MSDCLGYMSGSPNSFSGYLDIWLFGFVGAYVHLVAYIIR